MNISHKTYQRYLEPGFIAFDLLKLAKETENIVCVRGRLKPATMGAFKTSHFEVS